MPVLSDAEFRMIAEVVAELARYRGTAFDASAQAVTLAHAASADAVFKARLAEIARRIRARRNTDTPRHLLAPLAPLFRDLEREAEAVLSVCKK
jgi:hypothetical protein